MHPRFFPFFVTTPFPFSLLTLLNLGLKWVHPRYYFDRLHDYTLVRPISDMYVAWLISTISLVTWKMLIKSHALSLKVWKGLLNVKQWVLTTKLWMHYWPRFQHHKGLFIERLKNVLWKWTVWGCVDTICVGKMLKG